MRQHAFNVKCHSCGKEINLGQDLYHVAEPRGGLSYGPVWHFQCLTPEQAFSNSYTLDSTQLARWSAWHISNITRENTALRRRTQALALQIEQLIRKTGGSEEEVEEFRFGFRLYDEELKPKNPEGDSA